MTLPRLTPSTELPANVIVPEATPESVGIVHLGWGAFHRAHQAVYTQLAMDRSGERNWGILGDVERTPALVPAAREQGGRYTVLTVGPDSSGQMIEQAQVVASVMDVAFPGDETPRLLAAMAAPTTHVITLTVTEKGYSRLPSGGLDVAQVRPDIKALRGELQDGLVSTLRQAQDGARRSAATQPTAAAATALGLLMRGLAARFLTGGDPVTVLSCDNMAANGTVLRALAKEFAEQSCYCSGDAATSRSIRFDSEDPDTWCAACTEFPQWIAANTSWPSSMVDRITPAATPATLDRVEQIIGARDEAAVSAEPFMQWVIEDNFVALRPKWELAGAQLVSYEAVATWEEAKLRMLNGTHSVIAYAGRLFGCATMAEAIVHPSIAPHARTYLFDDALPSVTPPAGADLPAYGEDLLRRFANPATGHTTTQVSTDGSQKIPFRWGAAAAFALENGRVPEGIAFGLAAWSEFVRRAVRGGVALGDPASAETLARTVTEAGVDHPATVAQTLISLPGILPYEVGANEQLQTAVARQAEALAAATNSLL